MVAGALKKLWKNEYFQTLTIIALEFVIVLGLYFSASAMLGAEYPALAVASGSMLPTLNIGDLIILQKVNPAEVHADPLTGDILVYKRGNELIVHRAVKIELINGVYWVTTRGDNNYVNDPPWPETALVGKVIARIPYVGNLPLFFHSERNMYVFLIICLVILVLLVLTSGSSVAEKPIKEEKKIWKINFRAASFFAINFLIVGFLIFSLWGYLEFWQPGASPARATIFGMWKDLQFHESFSKEALLHLGFMTYRIDCQVDGGIRVGVPTFSWFQLSLLAFIMFNAWKILPLAKKRRKQNG
ncbi:MAG: signal peptidase I [Nitrososphaerota archaeon]|nr:signal peptidase I [Candidatus Bathyarchaeota archaeon]MDW8022823.1 signal peptidase I [Nitrososphaerota archaeon]